jgi:hypothetical protein
MFVQKLLADLLDPNFSPVFVKLKVERLLRAVGKRDTLKERLIIGQEMAVRIKEIEKSLSGQKKLLSQIRSCWNFKTSLDLA